MERSYRFRFWLGLSCLVLLASALFAKPAAAATLDPSVLCDNSGGCRALFADIDLPGGISGSLRVEFQQATGLSADSFDLSAELVDPRDPMLTGRLPAGVFIPDDFPVLVRINPKTASGFSFRGEWSLEIVAENLEFSSHTPYRLFASSAGGAFQDISVGLGSGSLRIRGSGTAFGEFVIANDLRRTDRLAASRFEGLQSLISVGAPSFPTVASELQDQLAAARQSFESGDLSGALGELRVLIQRIGQASEDGTIPDLSRPGLGQTSIGARLASAARSLQHALILERRFEQEPPGGVTRKLTVDNGQSLDITLSFDQSFVVDPEDLDIQAELVDVHDPGFSARFPPGVHVPEQFPVLIRIRQRQASGDRSGQGGQSAAGPRQQAFRGAFEIELVIDDLEFLGGTPLRLFKAPDGGAFEDVTRSLGLGSLRLRGRSGRFSDLVVAKDERDIDSIIGEKLAGLGELASDPEDVIDPEPQGEIEDLVEQVEEAIDEGRPEDALDALDELVEVVDDFSGQGIPDLWRSDDDSTNVGGEMLSKIESLQFSIQQQMAPGPDPADVNRDGKVDVKDLFQVIDRVFGNG